jgi:putative transcriptional regulator
MMSKTTSTSSKQIHGRRRAMAPANKSHKAKTSSKGLSSAGSKIVSAFEEAIDAMRSNDPTPKGLTVRTYKIDFTPPAYGPGDVRRARALLGMSQVIFARFLGVDANTVRSWEQGSRPPSAIARRFMAEIEGNPAYWRQRVTQEMVEKESGPVNKT